MIQSPSAREHWERAYGSGDTTKGWYQPHAPVSLQLIQQYCPELDAEIIDVGGGASTLADDLLAGGYQNLTVLDLSETAMQITQERLGRQAADVEWVAADLLDWRPQRTYGLWHDRAVLHFLTEAADQEKYRQTLLSATGPGSIIVIGVFGPEGPNQCSGLPVKRYDVPAMHTLLSDRFSIIQSAVHTHTTPSQKAQQFLWIAAERLR